MEVLHLLVDPVAHGYGEKSSTNRGEIHGWGGHAETSEKGVFCQIKIHIIFVLGVLGIPLSFFPPPRPPIHGSGLPHPPGIFHHRISHNI